MARSLEQAEPLIQQHDVGRPAEPGHEQRQQTSDVERRQYVLVIRPVTVGSMTSSGTGYERPLGGLVSDGGVGGDPGLFLGNGAFGSPAWELHQTWLDQLEAGEVPLDLGAGT